MRHRLLFVAFAALLASDAAAGSRAESEEKLARASTAYDMKIDIAGDDTGVDSGVTCASMTSTHATLALPIFLPELTRYPSDFFSSTGIQRMVLCGDLTHGGKRVAR